MIYYSPFQILDVKNVVVVVSRWFGGILLGGDRFKLINNAARDALELGSYVTKSGSQNADNKKKSKKKWSELYPTRFDVDYIFRTNDLSINSMIL